MLAFQCLKNVFQFQLDFKVTISIIQMINEFVLFFTQPLKRKITDTVYNKHKSATSKVSATYVCLPQWLVRLCQRKHQSHQG